jgi:hypothetical protein
MTTDNTCVRDPRDVPTAWFVVLEQAIAKGDREREREARRNLARLGVHVTFRRRVTEGKSP